MSMTSETRLYYDPYDFEIDNDPYPVWKRMRDEAPLYYNERYDFFALTRFADVEPALVDWETYRSGRGSIDKLLMTWVEQSVGHAALAVSGAQAAVDGDDVALKTYLYSRAQSVMGGTSQIQKNIIATRILGLPTG